MGRRDAAREERKEYERREGVSREGMRGLRGSVMQHDPEVISQGTAQDSTSGGRQDADDMTRDASGVTQMGLISFS